MTEAKPEVWAVVELMGHVRLAGRLTEEEKFGAKMGRLDIPKTPDPKCPACEGTGRARLLVDDDEASCWNCCGFVTQYFGGGSVYRITFVTEEAARLVAARSQPEPVHSWELPEQLSPATASDDSDDEIPFG